MSDAFGPGDPLNPLESVNSLSTWLILFDCDGTLVDSEALIVKAMQIAFENGGIEPPPPGDIRSIVGLSLPFAIEALFDKGNHRGRDPHLIKTISENYKVSYGYLRDEKGCPEPLFEGVRDLIVDLAAQEHCVLGIATGKSMIGVQNLLKRFELGPYFMTIQTADNAPSKPHPAMIDQAIRETGVALENCIMIGDTSFDLEMAQAACVKAIGVSWGHHCVKELRSYRPHDIVDDIEQLKNSIYSLMLSGFIKD